MRSLHTLLRLKCMQEPVVRAESSPQAVSLAKKLKAAGAKMYGAFWCSHCQEQKAEFGAAAQKDLPYVECYPQGYHKVRACWGARGAVSPASRQAVLECDSSADPVSDSMVEPCSVI